MVKRILVFVLNIVGALLIGAVTLAFSLSFTLKMEYMCALDDNNSYTCQTRDMLLGKYPIFENKYENVVDISFDSSKCNKGCTWRAEFTLASGEIVPLRGYYTNNENIPSITHEISQKMAAREAEISYIPKEGSAFWAIAFTTCMTGVFLFVAIIKLIFGNKRNLDENREPVVIDLRLK